MLRKAVQIINIYNVKTKELADIDIELLLFTHFLHFLRIDFFFLYFHFKVYRVLLH